MNGKMVCVRAKKFVRYVSAVPWTFQQTKKNLTNLCFKTNRFILDEQQNSN